MLYPTKAGKTNAWFIHPNFQSDPRWRNRTSVSGNMTDGYLPSSHTQIRMSVESTNQFSEHGCENDFEQSYSRGFVNASTDWTNVEVTGFFKLTEGPEDNSIVLRGPGGDHQSGETCCSGSQYGVRMLLGNPVQTRFLKEMWHVSYFFREPQNISGANYSLQGHGWFGVKLIHYIKGVNPNKTVKLECWYNADGLGQNWAKVNETEDTGGWGTTGGQCGGDPDQILAWGNAHVVWRWGFPEDDSDLRFRWLSVREIDPFKTFDEDPTDPNNPPTNPSDITTFQSTLKLQRNINYDNQSCGTGAGPNVFYNNLTLTPPSNNAITKFYFNTIGIGEQATNSFSPMVGNTLHTLEIPLRKFGLPAATPVVQAKIFNAAGTILYTSPTTFDPTTFTTSYVTKTFDFSSNTRIFVAGDSVGVFVDETTDDADFVQVGLNPNTILNSTLAYQEDPTVFTNASFDLNCRMTE